jgi:cytochrome c oxidase subunit 4
MDGKETQYHIVDYGTYVLVWFGLLILTGITIVVASMNLGGLSILTALLIALIKSGLVFYFFMHLEYEEILFQIMLFFPFIMLAIFIGLTFFDISFR